MNLTLDLAFSLDLLNHVFNKLATTETEAFTSIYDL